MQILQIICKDKTGIVAQISSYMQSNNINILNLNQYSDINNGMFFMRLEIDGKIDDSFNEVIANISATYRVIDSNKKPKILVMVSKEGHVLSHLLSKNSKNYDIVAIGSNHNKLFNIAQWYGIDYHYISSDNKEQSESKIIELMQKYSADYLVLARYMQILSPQLCQQLQGRAINIHHSFLPSFKGANPYRQAYDRGVKIIGATAHFVTCNLDEGPIIAQQVQQISHNDNIEQLKNIGQDIEALVLHNAIEAICENRVFLNNNKTVVF